MAIPHEPRADAAMHELQNVVELVSRRGRRRVEHRVFCFVANEHAVENQDVQMNIKVKAAPEALHECDGSGLDGT